MTAEADRITTDLSVQGPGWQLQGRVTVPAGPTSLRLMLPVVQSLANGVVSVAVRRVEGQGGAISCKKGCGACCRQLVPVSAAEAHQLRDLVERLPEPRRSEVRARFAAARRRLEETGVLEHLERRGEWTGDEPERVGLEYFRLGIACPFLDDESCSIHPERPVSCREYLVTTPAECCAQPTEETVRTVPLPARAWVALARCESGAPARGPVPWVPLVLALEWAESHPEPPPTRTGMEWLGTLLEQLTGQKPPDRRGPFLLPS
jgi:Fe-S-cluster containining protein